MRAADRIAIVVDTAARTGAHPLRLVRAATATTPATFEVDRSARHVVVPAHGRTDRMDAVPIP